MFVFQQVQVASKTEVWRFGCVIYLCHLVVVFSLDLSYLYYGEILVVEVQSQCSFYLTIVAERLSYRSGNIYRYSEAPEQRDGVFLESEELSLCLYGGGSGEKCETTCQS